MEGSKLEAFYGYVGSNDTQSVEPKQTTSSRNGLDDFYNFIGGSTQSMDSNMDTYSSKLVNVESYGGDYNAVNKDTGAYGKYQFIPKTMKELADKEGITLKEARTPEGQERIFKRWTQENDKGIMNRGLETTELNRWIAHNQGLGGLDAILGRSKMTPEIRRNISANLPKGMKPTAENYINHWSQRFDG